MAKHDEGTPAPQAAPSDDLHIVTGLRLRIICEKLGLGKAVPEDPAELWAVAFSVLGMVRHEIENLQRAPAVTQAAPSEPVAWMHPDGRVVTAASVDAAKRDGASVMLSVLNDYTIPLYARASPQQAQADARDAALEAKLEARAKEIYEGFEGAEDHPWQVGGNSLMQDKARRFARMEADDAIAAATTSTEGR